MVKFVDPASQSNEKIGLRCVSDVKKLHSTIIFSHVSTILTLGILKRLNTCKSKLWSFYSMTVGPHTKNDLSKQLEDQWSSADWGHFMWRFYKTSNETSFAKIILRQKEQRELPESNANDI